jgi:molecular chaperone DnaJ
MLKAGARIRLQIRRGLSDEITTVEVQLPQDYVTGKPVRLKGMGKRIGHWRGDLYLTLVAKQSS